MKCPLLKMPAVAIAGMLANSAALATPYTFDFIGTGTFCAAMYAQCEDDVFSGVVTLDVLSLDASGPDSGFNDDYAYDYEGWVNADIDITWSTGSFNPEPFLGSNYSDHLTEVHQAFAYDMLYNREWYERFGSAGGELQYAYLQRDGDTSWLSDWSYPGELEMPFGEYSGALIYFSSSYWGQDNISHGFVGQIALSTFTLRQSSVIESAPASVPEPATLGLLALGILGAAAARKCTSVTRG